MLMCPPVPTSLFEHTSSFSLPFYSISLSLCLSRALSKPSSHSPIPPVPQLPFLSPAMLPCRPLGKEMRRGTDANILDPSLLPWLTTPRQKRGCSEEERRGNGEGGRGGGAQRLDRKADLHKACTWLVHDERDWGGCSYVKVKFIIMQTAFFGEVEQQRKRKPLNTVQSLSLQCYFSSTEGSFLLSAPCLVYL